MTINIASPMPGNARTPSCEQLRELDEEIIELLARRRALVRELPAPAGPRAVDPSFTGAVRDTVTRYGEQLGSGSELVARAILVLCDPGDRA
ncbi:MULTISPECIES: chorismate mutase [unclassified Streptomyces]|uniref:chorismate mutase n=1 Tax=unclassified Streptomyces TaxID=2593676 RepID=UPI00278BDDEF|nr:MULTISPECIES: chorismate mutase [unclassified Streptomyces]